jgi:histidine ammonia-lyase
MTLILDTRKDFTLEACRRVAWGRESVTFGPQARAEMALARQQFMALVEDPDVTIYGVNTGYGHQAKLRLTPEQRKAQAAQPTWHRAASWGDPLPERVVRAIVFARLSNFIEGHAAISPHIAEAVAQMLDGADMPEVPARGQGGAGEILSLSHVFGELVAASDLGEKDMLSLVNGSPAATALVADGALASAGRLDAVAAVLALAAEAFNTPLGHYAADLEDCWNNAADAWALRKLRALIGGGHGGARRPYQAPVSFRIMPRILGQARRASTEACRVAEDSLAAVSDNPVFLRPDARRTSGEMVSTGGYHNAQAPMALDNITASYANLCIIAERMAAKLLDPAVSLLPPFLGLQDGLSYLGCLPMAIAGYAGDCRALTQATLLPGSESGGFGQDDVASPVFAAWSKQERAGELLEQSVASLAPIALRALRITGRPVPDALKPLAAQTAEAFPDDGHPGAFGPQCARLATMIRKRIYSV